MADFDWNDFLLLARSLRESGAGQLREATLRTAVSRAYYAAYHHTIREMKASGFYPDGSGIDHSMILSHLEEQGLGEKATLLRSLRRMRDRCDYDNRGYDLGGMALIAVANAFEISGDIDMARAILREG